MTRFSSRAGSSSAAAAAQPLPQRRGQLLRRLLLLAQLGVERQRRHELDEVRLRQQLLAVEHGARDVLERVLIEAGQQLGADRRHALLVRRHDPV